MKVIGIQIKSTEAILVVLEQNEGGEIVQTNESAKYKIDDPNKSIQVRQFRDQINTAFDLIKPDRIGIYARNPNAKGDRTPSPNSFKLEGIIQLYDAKELEFIWPISIASFKKKNTIEVTPKHKYQEDAFNVAYLLLNKK